MIKVFIVPNFLYIFRVLPVWLPKSFLHKCQRDIFQFIWNNQPHRISRAHMKRQIVKGGLAVPDLLLYHRAAVLAGLVKLYNTNYKTGWKSIENYLLFWNCYGTTKRLSTYLSSYLFLSGSNV